MGTTPRFPVEPAARRLARPHLWLEALDKALGLDNPSDATKREAAHFGWS